MKFTSTSERTRPAVFFDRDGTLNEDCHFPHKIDDLVLISGAIKAVRSFCDAGFLIVIITNQSGIARGYFDTTTLNQFNDALCNSFFKNGGRIDLILHCPHHPDFSGPCSCRKPRPGLIQMATERLPIDLQNSLLIGDSSSDVECAKAAGINGYLFPGGDLYDFCKNQKLLR